MYRASATKRDPCYLGLARGGLMVHLSCHAGDGMVDRVVCFLVDNVHALRRNSFSLAVPSLDRGGVSAPDRSRRARQNAVPAPLNYLNHSLKRFGETFVRPDSFSANGMPASSRNLRSELRLPLSSIRAGVFFPCYLE